MKKNVSGQVICAHLISKTDGSDVTSGTTTVYVTGDNGSQSSGGGTVSHKGNGLWAYAPTQAETNYNHVAFTFVNSAAVSVTVQVYTDYPQSGDSYPSVSSNLDAKVSSRSSHSAADVWSVATRSLTDKSGFSLSSSGIDAIWDATGSLGLSFETLLQRAYQIANNRMIVEEATGDVTLRNIGNSANIATGSVTSSSGSTTRAELSWV